MLRPRSPVTRRSGRLPVTFCLCMVHASLIPSHGTAGYSPPAFRSCRLFLPLFTPYRFPASLHGPYAPDAVPIIPSSESLSARYSSAFPPTISPYPTAFRPLPTFPAALSAAPLPAHHLPAALSTRHLPAAPLSSAIRSLRSDGRASGGFVLILYLPVVTIPGCVELICTVCCGDLVLLVKHKL